jgi:hypothetical protein
LVKTVETAILETVKKAQRLPIQDQTDQMPLEWVEVALQLAEAGLAESEFAPPEFASLGFESAAAEQAFP